ncbi:GGDEF domain-containing response regulator [Endothiovibrio diazotrophicus]
MELQQLLIVDDEKNNRALLTELFKNQYKIYLAKHGHMALELARKYKPDVILLDVLMPELDGYETLKALKEQEETRHIPVIFITALDRHTDEEKGLLLGAVDYISKPFMPAIVRARVTNHMQIMRQRRLLESHARVDALTELPNRRYLEERLQASYPEVEEISLAIMDVDRFKQYNDHYGHAAGDRVLQQVAKVLGGSLLRETDFIARYGGEEFVAILPHTDRPGALLIADGLRRAVEALGIEHDDSTSGVVTISIGGITVKPVAGRLPGATLEQADAQLYRSKQAGRNRVTWG